MASPPRTRPSATTSARPGSSGRVASYHRRDCRPWHSARRTAGAAASCELICLILSAARACAPSNQRVDRGVGARTCVNCRPNAGRERSRQVWSAGAEGMRATGLAPRGQPREAADRRRRPRRRGRGSPPRSFGRGRRGGSAAASRGPPAGSSASRARWPPLDDAVVEGRPDVVQEQVGVEAGLAVRRRERSACGRRRSRSPRTAAPPAGSGVALGSGSEAMNAVSAATAEPRPQGREPTGRPAGAWRYESGGRERAGDAVLVAERVGDELLQRGGVPLPAEPTDALAALIVGAPGWPPVDAVRPRHRAAPGSPRPELGRSARGRTAAGVLRTEVRFASAGCRA